MEIEEKYKKIPKCEYFDRCGGCSLQDLDDEFYVNFKKENIVKILQNHHILLKNQPEFVEIGENSRRRASFQVTNDNNLGFFAKKSNNLVKIKHCLMLEKDLENLIQPLQNLLRKLPFKLVSSISVCSYDNIVDVILNLQKDDISLEISELLSEFVRGRSINLSYKFGKNIMPIYLNSSPQLDLGNIKINLPSNVFLQATKKGQKLIVERIIDFARGKNIKNAADFYSGAGVYGFSLLDFVEKIDCFEGDEKMINSINNNAKKQVLTHKITGVGRDLVRSPLQEKELKKYDFVIINPPRNGAKAQILELIKSEIKNIIMISCDLNSFAKDTKILVENGFVLEKLSAIDQFYYTTHIELVATFTKPISTFK